MYKNKGVKIMIVDYTGENLYEERVKVNKKKVIKGLYKLGEQIDKAGREVATTVTNSKQELSNNKGSSSTPKKKGDSKAKSSSSTTGSTIDDAKAKAGTVLKTVSDTISLANNLTSRGKKKNQEGGSGSESRKQETQERSKRSAHIKLTSDLFNINLNAGVSDENEEIEKNEYKRTFIIAGTAIGLLSVCTAILSKVHRANANAPQTLKQDKVGTIELAKKRCEELKKQLKKDQKALRKCKTTSEANALKKSIEGTRKEVTQLQRYCSYLAGKNLPKDEVEKLRKKVSELVIKECGFDYDPIDLEMFLLCESLSTALNRYYDVTLEDVELIDDTIMDDIFDL